MSTIRHEETAQRILRYHLSAKTLVRSEVDSIGEGIDVVAYFKEHDCEELLRLVTFMYQMGWRDGKEKTEREQSAPSVPGFNQSGSKYLREMKHLVDGKADVYAVIVAFAVTCPARAHAIKKLLCSGIRGKGDVLQDLREARDAIRKKLEEFGREKNLL